MDGENMRFDLNTTRRVVAVHIATALLLLTSCGKTGDHSEGVKIGVVGPFEGPNSHIGRMIMNSVKLYFDKNQSAALKIDLIPIDDKSNPADAVSALQAIVGD